MYNNPQPSAPPMAAQVQADSNFTYGVGDPVVVVAAQPVAANDRSTLLPNRQSKCSCCCGCSVGFLICITIFLLLFFLIPRPPRSSYEDSTVTFSPYTITQTYKVKNRNMYSLTLSDLDLTVSTTISTGDTIVGTGSFLGNDSSIVIPKNSDKEISVFYVFDTTPAENNIARQQCQSPTGVKYVTSGTIDMKTWSTNFQDVSVGPWSVTYFC